MEYGYLPRTSGKERVVSKACQSYGAKRQFLTSLCVNNTNERLLTKRMCCNCFILDIEYASVLLYFKDLM